MSHTNDEKGSPNKTEEIADAIDEMLEDVKKRADGLKSVVHQATEKYVGIKMCRTCEHAKNHLVYDDGGHRVSELNVSCQIFKDVDGHLFISPINNPGCLRWKKRQAQTEES